MSRVKIPDPAHLIYETADYALYDTLKGNVHPWRNVKLILAEEVVIRPSQKRTFWLSWNTVEHRWGRNLHSQILGAYYPSINKALQDWLAVGGLL